ncbi:glycosyltransferase [uncultured Mitsuokella sp.]|uniref:glycosyltransferase n=1 Tax=uncultured Mitsuokella sp. TaxID=453120 RepID=UPI0025E2126D|nr:glycosyltransferase [uncultured Mitsuokella sp.]
MERILQYGISSNLGGIESYILQQMNYIDHDLLSYDFVYYGPAREFPYENQIRDNGGRIYYLPWPKKNLKNFFLFYYHLAKIIKNNHYKGVVLNLINLRNASILLIAKICGVPLRIIHSHNAGTVQKDNLKNKIINFIDKMIIKFSATNYFACSNLAGKWMFGEKSKFALIPNAIECKKFEFNPLIRQKVRDNLKLEDKFVIGHVARFCRQKNNEYVIEIYNQIYIRKKNSILLLIGSYNNDAEERLIYQRVRKKIQEYGLCNNVIFLGMRKDVFELYQAMDCLLLPSHFEGFPVVAIEAQAAGLPCYFSDKITAEVNITDLVTFLPIDTNPNLWAEKILTPSKIDRVNMNEKVAKAGYDIQANSKRIQDFYLQRK